MSTESGELQSPEPKPREATRPTRPARAKSMPADARAAALVLPASLGSDAAGLRALAQDFAAFAKADHTASRTTVTRQTDVVHGFVAAIIVHGPGQLHARSTLADVMAVYHQATAAAHPTAAALRRATAVVEQFVEFAALAVEEG